jgi:hypothetical protein
MRITQPQEMQKGPPSFNHSVDAAARLGQEKLGHMPAQPQQQQQHSAAPGAATSSSNQQGAEEAAGSNQKQQPAVSAAVEAAKREDLLLKEVPPDICMVVDGESAAKVGWHSHIIPKANFLGIFFV